MEHIMTIDELLNEMSKTKVKIAVNRIKGINSNRPELKLDGYKLLSDAVKSGNVKEYIESINNEFNSKETLTDDQKKRRIYKSLVDDLKFVNDHLNKTNLVPSFSKLNIEHLTNFQKALKDHIASMQLPPKSTGKRENNEKSINLIISKFLEKVNTNSKLYNLELNTKGTSINKDQISKLKRDQSFKWSNEKGLAFEFESKKTDGIKPLLTKKGLMFAEVEKKYSARGQTRAVLDALDDKTGEVTDHNFKIQTEWNDKILKQINLELASGNNPYLLCGQSKDTNIFVIYPDQYNLTAERVDHNGALRIVVYAKLNAGVNPSSIMTLKEFLARMLVESKIDEFQQELICLN